MYDLVRHCPVPFGVKDGRTEIPVSYETNNGKVLMVVDCPPGELAFRVVGTKLVVTSPDREAPVRAGLLH